LFFTFIEYLNESDIAFKLDKLFYGCKITDYFSNDITINYELEYNDKINKINEYVEEFSNENGNNNNNYIERTINFLFDCIKIYEYNKSKKITLVTLLYKLLLTKTVHLYINDNLILKKICLQKAIEMKKYIEENLKFENNTILSKYENLMIILNEYLDINNRE